MVKYVWLQDGKVAIICGWSKQGTQQWHLTLLISREREAELEKLSFWREGEVEWVAAAIERA